MTLSASPAEYRANILAAWARVDAIDRAEGLIAYERYHATLRLFADRYALPVANVVGAFSALSPNNDYIGNLRSLVTVLDGWRAGAAVDSLTISTYNACRDRAWRFLGGADFLTVTKGPKTRNFYRNILDPSDPEPVTIDGHMVGLAHGVRLPMKDSAPGSQYDPIADAFRAVAVDVGLRANQLQSTLWFTWKRIHNVIYSPQLDAFRVGNQWACSIECDAVRPFPRKIDRATVRG